MHPIPWERHSDMVSLTHLFLSSVLYQSEWVVTVALETVFCISSYIENYSRLASYYRSGITNSTSGALTFSASCYISSWMVPAQSKEFRSVNSGGKGVRWWDCNAEWQLWWYCDQWLCECCFLIVRRQWVWKWTTDNYTDFSNFSQNFATYSLCLFNQKMLTYIWRYSKNI